MDSTKRPAREINVSGERFPVSTLTMGSVCKLQGFLAKAPPPEALARAREETEGLPAEVRNLVLVEAFARDRAWPPSLMTGTAEAVAELLKVDGGPQEFFAVALQQARPDLSPEWVREAAAGLSPYDPAAGAILDAAIGRSEALEVPTPKAEMYVMTKPGLMALVRDVAERAGSPIDIGRIAEAVATLDVSSYGVTIELAVGSGGGPDLPVGRVAAGGDAEAA